MLLLTKMNVFCEGLQLLRELLSILHNLKLGDVQ